MGNSDMTITYTVGDGLYINMTNRCTNSCVFCVRQNQTGVGDAESLWLPHEPSLPEILDDLQKRDLADFSEIVFCGYGEPLCRLDDLIAVCRDIKAKSDLPVRINTNGQSDLINGRSTARELAGLADIVSVSLNAPTAQEYDRICHSEFGQNALPAIIEFAKQCKDNDIQVILTAVDILTPEQMSGCRAIADGIGVGFRERHCY